MASFFGREKTPWPVVAIAMISGCMSGVTFVSVPGMVATSGMGYLQMNLGFMAGYALIAFVLIPLYYRLDVVSVYQYLETRFGPSTYRTGAWFFFISKMLGASVRLYLVCIILQMLVFAPLGLPFALNVLLNVAVLYAYTFRGGVRAVIWADVLMTACMVSAVVMCIVFICREMGLSLPGLADTIAASPMSRVFYFDDINDTQYFWKQFLGGLFTVVAMTGLDQDMMQRALSCPDKLSSQKNMLVSTVLQTIVVALLLCLGVLLYDFAAVAGISETGDLLFPAVATSGKLPAAAGILFVLGIAASAYGSGGSALTALTTSFTIDILGAGDKEGRQLSRIRAYVHAALAVLMALTILVFNALNSTSAVDAVFRIASYTYGPLLGMFAFGMISKRRLRDSLLPVVAVAAPLICLALQLNSEVLFGSYRFSYEILPLNALLTCFGLFLISKRAL